MNSSALLGQHESYSVIVLVCDHVFYLTPPIASLETTVSFFIFEQQHLQELFGDRTFNTYCAEP